MGGDAPRHFDLCTGVDASGTPASSRAWIEGASAASWAHLDTNDPKARTLRDKVEAAPTCVEIKISRRLHAIDACPTHWLISTQAPTSDAVESATSAPRSSDASSFDGAWRPKSVRLNVLRASRAVL